MLGNEDTAEIAMAGLKSQYDSANPNNNQNNNNQNNQNNQNNNQNNNYKNNNNFGSDEYINSNSSRIKVSSKKEMYDLVNNERYATDPKFRLEAAAAIKQYQGY